MIRIGHKVYNTLATELQKHREHEEKVGFDRGRCPWLYLVASRSEEDTITKVYRLKENTDKRGYDEVYKKIDSCYRMSNLSAKEFIRASIKIMKKGYIVRGLVRVGNFTGPNILHHQDGPVTYELYSMNPNLLFITIEPTNMKVQKSRMNKEFGIVGQNDR